ncbi:MAG TPA: DUF456 domain-containing protein [Nocardioides sp.]|uniref:DUF456 domain-containing protein n=1 Tax=Nocardioides sp. TaxID=35761 RepID=UPI002F42480D
MTGTVIVCALLVAAGLAGIVVPVLPGTLLVALGIVIWAFEEGTTGGWVVFAVAAACLVVGAVVKYAVPGRRLKATVPTRTLLVGALGAVVGFFVIPVVGALAGFPLGVYVAERVRLGGDGAWTSTKAALRAVGASILIELLAALVATVVWAVGVVVT